MPYICCKGYCKANCQGIVTSPEALSQPYLLQRPARRIAEHAQQ